jgi:DNA-binding beta-propeller fold protein YncE
MSFAACTSPAGSAREGAHLLKRFRRALMLLAVLVATLVSSVAARAACSNPAGAEGDHIYNSAFHVLQYCNGTAWQAMGPVPGAGGAGCANPSGAEGNIRYNFASHVLQYCDGTNWIAMGPVPGTGASIVNGENATDALGQFASTSSDATVVYTTGGANNNNGTTESALGFSGSTRLALDPVNHRLFVADLNNIRVLVYNLNTDNSIPASPGHTASYVLGQPNFTSNAPATTQAGLATANGLVCDAVNNRLFVADSANNRVLVFNTATITNGMNAAYELGQPSGTAFTTATAATTQSGMNSPVDVAFDAANNRLFVADRNNYRVTVFDVTPGTIANGENAAYELGQPSGGTAFTTATPATTQSGMNDPRALAYDATNNRLFEADNTNNRVLVYNTAAITNGMNASNVLGQTLFTTATAATTQAGMWAPRAFAYYATNNLLFVCDNANNRVTVFDVTPGTIVNGENAAYELGQPSGGTAFTTATPATTQSGLFAPQGLAFDSTNNRLFVAEYTNNRVLEFASFIGCANPIGNEGGMRYNSASHVMQYCDGTNWRGIGPSCAPSGFTDQPSVQLSTLTTSNIAWATHCASQAVSISGTGSPQYRICSDVACGTVVQTWGSTAGTVNPGQYIQLELTSSASGNTTNSATLTVGSASTTWNATTWLGYQRVFITSGTVTGAISGTAGTAAADATCAAAATGAGLSGTWKAWIAVTTASDTPLERFTHPTFPYKLVDGTTTIANNWTGLISGTLVAGISEDQTGTAVTASTHVYTNVTVNSGAVTATVSGSNSAGNCSAWTITGSGTKKGIDGLTSSATATWSNSGSGGDTCSTTDHLYCFEQ